MAKMKTVVLNDDDDDDDGEEKKFLIIVSTTIKVIESIFNVVSIVFLGSNVFHRVSDNSNNIINKYH